MEFTIDESSLDLSPAGVGFGFDPSTVDHTMHAEPPSNMALMTDAEIDAMIAEQEREESGIEHILRRLHKTDNWMPLDQNGDPLCWGHSTTHAHIAARAVHHQPYVQLSAYGLSGIANGWRNQGGWNGLSAKAAREIGVPLQSDVPQGQFSRSLDTPEMRANAARFKTAEEWVDLQRSVYDQNLTWRMIQTCLCRNQPVMLDYNEWSHSVLGVGLKRLGNRIVPRILNSWYRGPGVPWGDMGFATLDTRWSTAPAGAICIRSALVSRG